MPATYQVTGPLPYISKATEIPAGRPAERQIPGLGVAGKMMKYWAAGTFGLLSPAYLHANAATSNWAINKIEILELHNQVMPNCTSCAAEIEHIRDALQISVTELAKTFGVTRQAVHDWIKGGIPSPVNADRISKLAKAADVLLAADLEITPHLLRRKIGSSPSVLESVIQDIDTINLAQKLAVTLTRERQQRELLASRLRGRKKISPQDFAIPHLSEDT